MKRLEDVSLDEYINYWTGRLTLAIGAGKFRDEVCLMIGAITQEAYNRGAKNKARRRS